MTPFGTTPPFYVTVANCKVILAIAKITRCQNRNELKVSFHVMLIIDNHCWVPGRLIDLPVTAWTQSSSQEAHESVNQLPIRLPSSSNLEADQGTQPLNHTAVRPCSGVTMGGQSDQEPMCNHPPKRDLAIYCPKGLNQYESQSI